MSQEAAVAFGFAGESSVGKLAVFFPAATPVRLAVQVSAGGRHSESTVIEFGTAQEIFFASSLPLQFGQGLRVHNADGSLDAEVQVVALQYSSGKTAVAARFARPPLHWLVKP